MNSNSWKISFLFYYKKRVGIGSSKKWSTVTEDYREMMKDVKEKVKNDEKEPIENLESVKYFKRKSSDEEIEEYVKNTEAMKLKKLKK